MITEIVSDFSRVLLFPKDTEYEGGLNSLYRKHNRDSDFDFFSLFSLNNELLKQYDQLGSKVGLSILTSEQIQKDEALAPIITPIFNNIYSAEDLGISKKDSSTYTFIAEQLNTEPQDILFIDDSEINVEAASNAGLITILYKSNEQLIEEISKIIS